MTEEIKIHLEFIGYAVEEAKPNIWFASKPSLPPFTVVSTDSISMFSWHFVTVPNIEEKTNELYDYINTLNNHSLMTRWSFFNKDLRGRAYYLHPYNKTSFFNFINFFVEDLETLKDKELGNYKLFIS